MLPDRILVNQRYYRVVLTARHPTTYGRKCDGVCDYHKKELRIFRGLSKRELLSTFFHELKHAMVHEYRLKHVSHLAIYDLEGPFADFYLANPQFAKFVKRVRPRTSAPSGS